MYLCILLRWCFFLPPRPPSTEGGTTTKEGSRRRRKRSADDLEMLRKVDLESLEDEEEGLEGNFDLSFYTHVREKVLNYIFLLTELLDNLAAAVPATEGELGVGGSGSGEEEADGAEQSPVETGTKTSSGFFLQN